MKFSRHDLVYLNSETTRKVAAELERLGIEQELILGFISQSIPLIVKQQPRTITDRIELGISFPKLLDGVRLRKKTTVPVGSVAKLFTPYEVADSFTASKEIVILRELAKDYGLVIGVFGSASLSLVTGHEYLHQGSDIDVIFRGNTAGLEDFLREYIELCASLKTKIDGEFLFGSTGSVKLIELASGVKTVMVKGLYQSFLAKREELMEKG